MNPSPEHTGHNLMALIKRAVTQTDQRPAETPVLESRKAPRANPRSAWRGIALSGYALISLTFGFGGVWAAVAKLDKAVIATGYVATETNSKTIQHFEGGIVREILVKEGQHVGAGQVLFRLQKVEALATTATYKNQLNSALAVDARLVAERDHTNVISWPPAFIGSKEPVLISTIADQQHQFEQRKASLQNQVDVLNSRADQLQSEVQGITIEKQSAEKQNAYIEKELVNLRELGAKQMVPMSRVYAMEREQARLAGVIGRAVSDTAKAKVSISEIALQIQELKQKFQEEVAASMLEVRQKVADLRERILVAQDILNREDIIAPRAGTIFNMKVFTPGQVIGRGEALLDIAPDDEPLVVNAEFAVTDIDNIYTGLNAEIRFPAFHSRTIPVMMGRLTSLSRDRIYNDQTRQYYYKGVIYLSRADIPEEYRQRIRPGMPAEIIIAAGERTVMSYLISPLSGSLRKAMREPND